MAVGETAPQNRIMESIFQPLYDLQNITAATLDLDFFQAPIGSGAPARTFLQTNMTGSGVLPNPYSFKVKAIRLDVFAGIPLADLLLILEGSFLEFNIQEKNYLRAPAKFFTSGLGISGLAAIPAAAIAAVEQYNNGTPDNNSLRVIDPFVEIGVLANFRVRLSFPVAPAALTAPVDVRVYLDGVLSRVVQ